MEMRLGAWFAKPIMIDSNVLAELLKGLYRTSLNGDYRVYIGRIMAHPVLKDFLVSYRGSMFIGFELTDVDDNIEHIYIGNVNDITVGTFISLGARLTDNVLNRLSVALMKELECLTPCVFAIKWDGRDYGIKNSSGMLVRFYTDANGRERLTGEILCYTW